MDTEATEKTENRRQDTRFTILDSSAFAEAMADKRCQIRDTLVLRSASALQRRQETGFSIRSI